MKFEINNSDFIIKELKDKKNKIDEKIKNASIFDLFKKEYYDLCIELNELKIMINVIEKQKINKISIKYEIH
jgi:hypothetical protein